MFALMRDFAKTRLKRINTEKAEAYSDDVFTVTPSETDIDTFYVFMNDQEAQMLIGPIKCTGDTIDEVIQKMCDTRNFYVGATDD